MRCAVSSRAESNTSFISLRSRVAVAKAVASHKAVSSSPSASLPCRDPGSLTPRPADSQARPRAHEVLELDHAAQRLRKSAAVTLDLSGIAKGFAVDQMIAVLARFGIEHALVGLDGELRAIGQRPEGLPWAVALEKPDYEVRAPLSMLELHDGALATSGSYRHWVDLGTQRLSHTMDPARGGPVLGAAASVTVLADTCMDADAWATAFMVMGKDRAPLLADDQGLCAIFVDRDGDNLRQIYIG